MTERIKQKLEAAGIQVTQLQSGAYRLDKPGLVMMVHDLNRISDADKRELGLLPRLLHSRWQGVR
ncbi:MAG: hypothetical protein H7293_16680 [Candidatus Saccharibacteria bacterium]|nr:hypothetical protein [Rhodoferax sp.]